MYFKESVRRLIVSSGYEIRRRSTGPTIDQLSVVLCQRAGAVLHPRVGTFLTENGVEHAVYDGYRYSIKQGWLAIPALRGLRQVQKMAGLTRGQDGRFREIAGTRTITASISEIHDFAEPILADHADLFERQDIRHCAPQLAESEYNQTIDQFSRRISQDLAATPGLSGKAPLRVLDVGCGRGFSTGAFSRLGHEVLGVDYDYDDKRGSASALMRQGVARLFPRDNMFINADMTCCPEITGESRDLIYSISCLEHIADISAACREMYRILRPGGRMLHRYNPFWAENGGHAFGILDAPWLHAVLSERDFERYLFEWRKHEAEIGLPWTRAGLNRGITISAMQRALAAAGFQIATWRETIRSPEDLLRLGPQTLANVQAYYPEVQLADLLATDIMFCAVKPA